MTGTGIPPTAPIVPVLVMIPAIAPATYPTSPQRLSNDARFGASAILAVLMMNQVFGNWLWIFLAPSANWKPWPMTTSYPLLAYSNSAASLCAIPVFSRIETVMLGYLACAAFIPLAAAELNVPSLTGPGKTSATFKGRWGSACASERDDGAPANTAAASSAANTFITLIDSVIVFAPLSFGVWIGASTRAPTPTAPQPLQSRSDCLRAAISWTRAEQ